MLRVVAHGVQVFIATHNLFLLRELEVLLDGDEFKEMPRRFFALSPPPKVKIGGSDVGVTVQQGANVTDIDPLVLLDEDLAQSDRYLDLHA